MGIRRGSIESIMSEDDMMSLLRRAVGSENATATETEGEGSDVVSGDEEAVTTGDEFEGEDAGESEELRDGVAEKESLLDEKLGRMR